MENQLTKKYGLFTAVCMVIGTVIGSGIFFRNEAILAVIGGNLWLGVFAWLLGGLITLICAYVFATLAGKYEKVGGLLTYAEELLGPRFAHLLGWYMAFMFYPPITGILAWVSARFTVILFGWDVNPSFSGQTYSLALFYLVAIYAVNALSPKLAGKVQVSTTIIKVIPLIAMGIIGTIIGVSNGTTLSNIQSTYVTTPVSNPFLAALVATAFAYMGWDGVINLNSEIKDSRKNLPIALVGGLLIIITIYILYFIGIFSAAPIEELAGGHGISGAFASIFTNVGGTALFVFIIISCIGTLNGLMMTGQRAFYSIAVRNNGFAPSLFAQVDNQTNVANNAGVLSLLVSATWILVYAGNFAGWYGNFFFDIPALVPISFNAFMIPVYLRVMAKEDDFNIFNRYIAPILAICGSLFLIYAVFYNHGILAILVFLAVFVLISIVGLVLYRNNNES